MISAVTFDVWNTLVVHEFYDDRLRLHRTRSLLEALRAGGYSYSWDRLVAAYDLTEERLVSVWKEERDLSNDGHLDLFLEALGLERSDDLRDLIREPYSHALLHFRPRLVDGAAGLLRELHGAGYRIGLISNTGRTPGRVMRQVLSGYGLLGCFDAMTFSDEAGYIKPSPRIFERALEQLNASAAEAVHVGDHPLLDVYGARASGLRSILFTKYMENFERYASKYYSAGGRHAEPDCTVAALGEVGAALRSLDKSS